MADAAPNNGAENGRAARVWRIIGGVLGGLIQRVYAIVLIAVILWASYRAIHYLVVFLMFPPPPPLQITQVPKRLDEALLRTSADDFAGMTATEHVRSPLSHFHRLDDWFQYDRFNDCTRSGCHSPLPHTQHREVRAFLNMHATSLHCAVCHYAPHDQHPELTWYDLHSGEPIDRPPLLSAYEFVISPRLMDAEALTPEDQAQLVRLLRAAANAAAGEPAARIAALAESAAAPRVSSDELRHAIAIARAILPRYFRGEYGAKLALRVDGGRPMLAYPDTKAAVDAYLALDENASESRRDELVRQVHLGGQLPSIECEFCHRAEGGWLDLSTVGYPRQRIEALHNPWISRTIEHMAEGQTLHLPRFIAPGTTTNETPPAPSSRPSAP